MALVAYVHPYERGYLAHVPQVPGSAATGTTIEEAAARARAIARDEAPIAAQQGFPMPTMDDGPTVNVDEKDLLPGDDDPLSATELARWLQRLTWSRERILQLVANLDEDQIHSVRDGIWGIKHVLEHLAQVQGWAAHHLRPWPLEPLAMLDSAVDELTAALEALQADDLARETRHYGVQWTPRKVVRRSLEVLAEVEQRLEDAKSGEHVAPPGFYWDGCETRDSDLTPLSAEEREQGLARLLAGRSTLRDTYPRVANGHRARQDLETLVRWLAGAFWYYRTRLITWPTDIFQHLSLTHSQLITRLRGLSEEERSMVYWSFYGEAWTPRKLMRRQIEHERQHYDQLRSWLSRA